MMKHLFLRTSLLLALAGGSQAAWADEVEAMFLVAELQSGKTESVMLTNDADADVPRLLNKERVIIIGGQRYSTSDVKGLRLEKRMVDGIETVAMTSGSARSIARRPSRMSSMLRPGRSSEGL